MKIIGSIEARMGSMRLPGKTLMPVFDGMSLLECVVRRFQQCESIEDIIVATTVSEKDDPIARWCQKHQVKFFRGSENNVLDRVIRAANTCAADAIVQMGADSAYLDFELMETLIQIYQSGDYDYVCNDLVLTYPLGIYGHIVRVATLEQLNLRPDLTENDRIDVVRKLFEEPDQFRIKNREADPDFRFPQLRLTIDYSEDLEQARQIYAHFNGYRFTTREIIALYKQRPDFFEKTMHLVQQSAPHIRVKK